MKFLKRLMSKRNKAGFTLVEVVISVGLIGILLVGMMIFITPILRLAGETQKDVRASILGETVNSYIARSLMNSKYVAVFRNVSSSGASKDNDIEEIMDSGKLQTFSKFFSDNGSDSSLIYEVRCIGINWVIDEKNNEGKYILTQNKVGLGTSASGYRITATNKVFEDCFYEGLFPVITVDQAWSTVDPSEKAAALKLNIDVYSDEQMENAAVLGEGYAEIINIEKNTLNGSNKKLMTFQTLNATILNKDGNKVEGDMLDEIDETNPENTIVKDAIEHPDVYIFYITRKSF